MKRVVIVGAGLAGAMLSRVLHASDKCEVTVIDKGPVDSYLLDKKSKNKLAQVSTYCFGNGGTTNLWHNGLILPSDNSTKGFSLLEYVNQAAKILGYNGEKEFDKFVKEIRSSFSNLHTDVLFYPESRMKIVAEYNECYFNSDVVDISINGGVVDSIKIKTKSGSTNVSGDVFIFSCGGLGTPRLLKKLNLLQSGMSFIDHPMGFVGKVQIKRNFLELFSSLVSRKVSGGEVKTAIVCDIGGLRSALYFRPAFLNSNNKSIVKYKSLLGASSGVELINNLFDKRIFHPDIISEVAYKLFGLHFRRSVLSLMLVCEQIKTNNLLSMDRAELRISSEEINIYRQHICYYNKLLAGYCQSMDIEESLSEADLWSAAHYSGGDCLSDVVDADSLKYVDLDNLYVCDGSVLSSHSYTNTGLEIVARALKLAESIK